jgi:hypothetical protein
LAGLRRCGSGDEWYDGLVRSVDVMVIRTVGKGEYLLDDLFPFVSVSLEFTQQPKNVLHGQGEVTSYTEQSERGKCNGIQNVTHDSAIIFRG